MTQAPNLTGLLNDVASRLNQPNTSLRSDASLQVSQVLAPYYMCQRGYGFSVSAPDWSDDFEKDARTLYEFDFASPTGYLQLLGNTATMPVRALTCWRAEFGYSIPFIIHTAGNNVQLKFNGSVTDYSTTTTGTLDCRPGFNALQIAHDGQAGIISFEALLFSARAGEWVDPRSIGWR